MTDIIIFGINVISSCHRMSWLNTRLKYNFYLLIGIDCAIKLLWP